ncbi:MAG: FAD-dependent oxidoreductase, partial [Actinomycetota bacterium]|nr:FAD-dependent oxidoreductase [Actinomycetota bacterium]
EQTEVVEASLGRGTGAAWTAYVDAQAETWDCLREHVLEPADGAAALADRTLARQLKAKTSLAALHKKALKDGRLRLMAERPFALAGSQPRDVPAFAAVEAYVERTFGVWSIEGGLGQLTQALLTRLDERGVLVRLGAEVTALSASNDRVTGVETATGDHLAADVVVTDIDPRRVFGDWLGGFPRLPGHQVFGSATPAIPVGVTHLGLEGELPELPDEVVLYGEPLLVVNTRGIAPTGRQGWTVLRRGSAREDVLITLVHRGIDIRTNVVTRLDRTPVDLINETNGSSYGLAWAGWRAHVQRAAQTHPLPGLYLLGASMHPGSSIPYVGWGAAHVAARIGKATATAG